MEWPPSWPGAVVSPRDKTLPRGGRVGAQVVTAGSNTRITGGHGDPGVGGRLRMFGLHCTTGPHAAVTVQSEAVHAGGVTERWASCGAPPLHRFERAVFGAQAVVLAEAALSAGEGGHHGYQ